MGQLTENVFDESCCDGGISTTHASCQPCGCDPGIGHVCLTHLKYPNWGKKVEFEVKDSGQRQQFDSGMVRDTQQDKIDYSLALDGPMFERLAIHLTKGAKKYAARNWMQASGQAELDRFKQSAVRHFIQWLRGDVDEDHCAAVWFNTNGYEYTKERMKK